jgi:hypothetical protein
MASVNASMLPPTWFWISIVAMEVISKFTLVLERGHFYQQAMLTLYSSAIGFPIVQVFKSHKLHQETLDAIASWEKRQLSYKGSDSTIAESNYTSNTGTYSGNTLQSEASTTSSQRSDLFTMVALENALRTNPAPLLRFAALKDFSGENVSFLTHLADWRRAWLSPKISTAEHRRQQFVAAVRIYAHFVSLVLSEFPINISSREMRDLFIMFEGPATLLVRNRKSPSLSDGAAPFENVFDDAESAAGSTVELRSGANLTALGHANLKSVSHIVEHAQEEALAEVLVPETFAETVFDLAEREIKYLILTNTWPKFVNAGFDEQRERKAEEEPQATWLTKAALCSA